MTTSKSNPVSSKRSGGNSARAVSVERGNVSRVGWVRASAAGVLVARGTICVGAGCVSVALGKLTVAVIATRSAGVAGKSVANDFCALSACDGAGAGSVGVGLGRVTVAVIAARAGAGGTEGDVF